MTGVSVAISELPRVLRLYLLCSPKLDLNYRCLPRAGGLLDQDYETMAGFSVIEARVSEILVRQGKEMESKMKAQRGKK